MPVTSARNLEIPWKAPSPSYLESLPAKALLVQMKAPLATFGFVFHVISKMPIQRKHSLCEHLLSLMRNHSEPSHLPHLAHSELQTHTMAKFFETTGAKLQGFLERTCRWRFAIATRNARKWNGYWRHGGRWTGLDSQRNRTKRR